MNNREAMQALLDGKKIRHSSYGRDYYLTLNVEGVLCVASGKKAYLNPFTYNVNAWEIYEESGHDWDWALEQLRAGRRVKRLGCPESSPIYPASELNPSVQWLTATDWVLA